MTTTEAAPARTWRVVVREPLALAAAQPHQALISCASVALMAQFASSSHILDPLVGYALAVGVEWAYLRGLVADSKATTAWGARLNWSAFVVVVLWGFLWSLRAYGVLSEKPDGALAGGLALAHVLPIAWLSLCSAMSHRAMVQAEGATALADEATRRALAIEVERKRAEIALWEEGQAAKRRVQAAGASSENARSPQQREEDAGPKVYACPACGASLDMKQYAAAKRWGRCKGCRA